MGSILIIPKKKRQSKGEIMRAYLVFRAGDTAYSGFAVIADTAKEAIKIAFQGSGDVIRYIDIRAIWIKQARVDGLNKGVLKDHKDGLLRGMYPFIYACCDLCDYSGKVKELNGKAVCYNCYDKEALNE